MVFDRQFSAFKKGFNWGKNDAMIYLVDGSQCDNFTRGSQSQNQSNFLCSEGYDTGYGKIINEHHVYASVLAALHKALAYRTGYKIGGIWNSTSTMCDRNFTGRDELICYNGWSDARTRGLNDPVHCSSNDTATNSCYNMGESDGQELAQKFINVCSELDHFPKPPGVHSKKYVEGWHNGISDENAAAMQMTMVRMVINVRSERVKMNAIVLLLPLNHILQVLEPEIVLLDELHKLPRNFAEKCFFDTFSKVGE